MAGLALHHLDPVRWQHFLVPQMDIQKPAKSIFSVKLRNRAGVGKATLGNNENNYAVTNLLLLRVAQKVEQRTRVCVLIPRLTPGSVLTHACTTYYNR